MSEKSLGQIARQVAFPGAQESWEEIDQIFRKLWEDVAAAVKKEVIHRDANRPSFTMEESQHRSWQKICKTLSSVQEMMVDGLQKKVDELEERICVLEQDGEPSELLLKENERLKSGNFSDAEFQNLCHNLPDRHDAQKFCDGCEKYQQQLFGWSPITKLKDQVLSFREQHGVSRDPFG